MLRFQQRRSRHHRPTHPLLAHRLRLFVLVGLFVLVCVLIREARNPNHYRWLTSLMSDRLDGEHTLTSAARDDASGGKTSSSDMDESSQSAGFPVETLPRNDTWRARWNALAEDRRFWLLWHDAWQYVLDGLSNDDANTVGDVLLACRHAQPPQAAWAITIPPVLHQLDSALQHYVRTAADTLAVPDVDEQQAWQNCFRQLTHIWSDSLRPGLEQYVAESPAGASDEKRAWLDIWQWSWDQRLKRTVRDAAFFSNDETAYWFRCWEQCMADAAQSPPLTTVRVMDLVNKPERFRGVPVRLEGEVVLVRTVEAPANPLGISRYDVLWIRSEGTSQPLTAYCRQLPASLRAATSVSARLSDPMAVTVAGRFFKLMSYRSVRGIDVAPVLVVSHVEVAAPAPAAPATSVHVGWLVLMSAGLAIVAVVWIWRYAGRSTLPRSRIQAPPTTNKPTE